MKLNYKDWNLKYKILFAGVIPFVLAAVITIPILAVSIIAGVEFKSKLYVEKIAEGLGLVVGLEGERYVNEVVATSEILGSVSHYGALNDEIINQILSRSATRNKDFEGAWAVLEPQSQPATKTVYWHRRSDGAVYQVKFEPTENSFISKLVKKNKQSRTTNIALQHRAGDEYLLLLVHPVIDKQNNYVGSIGLSLHLDRLTYVLKKAKNYGIDFCKLIDSSGIVVASSKPIIKKRQQDTPEVLQAIDKLLINSSNPLDSVKEITPANNYDVYLPVRFTNVPDAWILNVSYPLDPGHMLVYANLLLMSAIFIICLVIGVLMSIVTAKIISSPIQQISIALSKITEGDFDTSIPKIDSSDEVAHIAKAAEILKQHSYDLLTAKKDAEHANLAKTEFLANMSHELRTPMHAILSYAKLSLQKIKANDSSLIKYLSNISTIGNRLLNLLNNLLDLAKLEAGKMEFNFAQSDMNTCIREVITELSPLITEKKLNTALRLLKKNSVAYFDREKFTQVLINILSNAIKFSPTESTITITATQPDASNIRISVQDEGIGIPAQEIGEIFNKFAQSSKTNKGSGGTGLGLSIARNIVEAHGGKIWAESKPDCGTTFNILLPISQAQPITKDAR